MRRFCYPWIIGWLWLPLMGHAAPVPHARFDQRLQQLSSG
jgi:hypothetical protein